MKKSLLFGIILTACVVIVAFVFSLGYPGGMISYWKFDEGSGTIASDSVGANDGALVNQPIWVPGKFMTALDFTTAKHVQVAESASLEPETITVEAWIKSNVYPGYPHYIVSKYLEIKRMSCSSYALYTADGGVKFYVARDDGGSWIGTPAGGAPGIWDGKWHHVAGTFNGAKLELYIDGSSAGSTTYTAGILYSDIGTDDLFIGTYDSLTSLYNFPGGIDEVAIYDRALSADEINQHYLNGSYEVACVSPPDGMVSWWPGDENANDIIDGNCGIPQNGATFAAGLVGQAFSLDGENDFVEVLDSDSLDTGTQFTIDAWFNTDDVDKIDPIRGTKTQAIVMYGFDDIEGKNNPLHIRDGKLYFAIRGYGAGYEDLIGVTPINSNTWYHAAVTYDGTTAKLYMDGALEDSTAATMNMNANSGVLIGRYRNPLQSLNLHHFDGLIDEVEIFNRALLQSEIQDIFLAGSAGKCKVIEVEIDIKPGSYPNSVNLGSKGSIPVAILSSACFDATTIDPDTVRLAGAGVAVRGKGNKFMAHEEYVNGDLLLDLVVQVETENFAPDSFQDGYAVLTGTTIDGKAVEGSDEITIVKDN